MEANSISPTPPPKTTNLLKACADGDIDSVRRICAKRKRRADRLCRQDNHNWYPVHHSVKARNIDCLGVLLSCPEINVNVRTFEGETSMFLACADQETPLQIVQMLHDRDPKTVDIPNNEKVTPLQMAVDRGRLDIVKFLVEVGQANINAIDLDGEHALFYAVRNVNAKMVEYLVLQPQNDITLKNQQTFDALYILVVTHHPVSRGNIPRKCCTKFLLQGIIRQTGTLAFEIVTPAIHMANFRRDVDVIDTVLEEFYLNPHHNEPDSVAVIKEMLLLARGQDVDPSSSYNYLALCLPLNKLKQTWGNRPDFWNHEFFINECCTAMFQLFRNHSDLFQKYCRALRQSFDRPITLSTQFFHHWTNLCKDANMDLACLTEFLWQFVKHGFNVNAYDNPFSVSSVCADFEINQDLFEMGAPIPGFRESYNFQLTLFAPFSTSVQPCLDDVVLPFHDDRVLPSHAGLGYPVSRVYGIAHCLLNLSRGPSSVTKLMYICRAAIRRVTFSGNASQYTKMVKLNSLALPLSVKNMLFYNSGNYNLPFE